MLDFSTTIQSRKSIRAFLPEPLSSADIQAVLDDALRSPSAANVQPWQIHIVSGQTLAKLSDKLLTAFQAATPSPDFDYKPSNFVGIYGQRMMDSAKILYGTLGIARDDEKARNDFAEGNFCFYNAPHCAFFFMPKVSDDNVYPAMDMGMLVQSFMLALTARGFGSLPQLALAYYPDVVRETLGVPDGYLMLGVSFGKPDMAYVGNQIRQNRASQSETVIFHS
ncbi:nitroreductase [Actinobacillus capsulatus]|uniref:nitroreductase n=1 Tax=Actinobacillus capsulatus TaxID=717 RepID=UPI000371E546|nr:nitroreductase family protein [Actinobacillus capsulatus]